MSHLGGFGNSAMLFPASLALFGMLLWLGRRADALAFLAALIVCLVATLIAKLAFHSCETRALAAGIESPSGHASFSATFYGCAALVLAAGQPPWRKIVLYAGAALFVLLIGASRIVIEVHTLPDVAAGFGFGAISIGVFQALRGPPRPLAMSPGALAFSVPAGAVLLAVILLFTRHWTPEPLIEAAAFRLDLLLSLCGPLS